MNNMSPEGFRTAAYLAAKSRLDARKTSRNVQCNPPNTRCGNRCIPPSWDCRLKGEGADNHLKAVKTDPLGGLANIERGVKRLGKGVLKGSPSDIHGGKQAIIRGVVKIAPGDLKKKEELRKQLERRTLLIGSGLAVLGLGLGAHALLMKNNVYGYRYGVGKNINEAVHTGVSRILDATPVLGGVRAQNRLGALSSVSEAVTRAARDPSLSPEALLTGLESNNPNVLRHLNELDIGSSNRNGNSNLNGALRAVNARARERGSTNSYAWNDQHREAFWGATVSGSSLGKGVPDRVSVFAGPATEDYLKRQHNLNVGRNASTSELKAALTNKLIEERENHVAFAKQLGLKTRKAGGYEVIDKDSIHDYIRAVNRRAGITGSGVSKAIKDEADKHLRELMNPRSLATYSDSIYKQSLIGFDKFYKDVAQRVQIAPGASSLSESFRMRSAAQPVVSGASRGIQPSLRDSEQMLVRSLDRARVSEMARQMNLPRNTVMGDAHSALISNAYFATRVAGGRRSTYSITDRLAVSAASELAGREITSTTDAFRLLQSEYGFTGATRVRASAPTTQSGARRSGGLRGQAQLSELARRIMARAGNEGMTMEAALRQARRERGDGDDFSPELVRTATYLAARADFKEGNRRGKPCGASHIPKAHECRKGKSAAAPENVAPKQGLGKKIALAAVVGAIGAVAVTVGLDAYKHFNASDFPNPPSYRDAIRAAQAGDSKMPYDVAVGKHYDKVVETEGWKPGQLVYTRFGSNSGQKDPIAHFAVYMGKNGDSHQFADLGVVRGSTRESEIYLYEYGPGNKGVTPFIFAKAPPLKGSSSPYSPEEIQQRVFSSLGARLKYDALDNNCETWARMITTGVPRSVQTERLSRLTRSLYRELDRHQRGAPIKTLPSVKQQARILDYQARMASGDKDARAELKAFQALIAAGQRTDAATEGVSGLPTPAELLKPATSDVEVIVRTKMYLMLLIRTLEAGLP